MRAFLWDQRFETGIATVDRQHLGLVETVNELGNELMNGELPEAQLNELFQRLAQYAVDHFAHEEKLMADQGIDPRHQESHTQHHRQFVEQVVSIWQAKASIEHPAQVIHEFLAGWLTVHILGEDQVMARQLARIARGESAASAYDNEPDSHDPTTAILLGALGRLYGLLSEQNLNLMRINQTLEQRVEQRTRELAEASRQLMQSEKLAAIGQLAAGVAHEINNPIGFVNSNLGTLSRYFGDLKAVIDAYRSGDAGRIAAAVEAADLEFLLDDARDLLDESLDGLGRVKKIVQDLRDFSRVDRGGREPTDLNAALASTLRVAAGQLGAGTEIVTEFGELPPVVCDAARINQVFLNLLLNAAQAIAGQGRITVRSGRDDDGVWVSVEDTGCGIPPEIRDHIFEPFFTTRPVGQGTGLGLSTCHDIVVKEHGGRIDVDSQPGRGSVFRVRLPLTAG